MGILSSIPVFHFMEIWNSSAWTDDATRKGFQLVISTSDLGSHLGDSSDKMDQAFLSFYAYLDSGKAWVRQLYGQFGVLLFSHTHFGMSCTIDLDL